MNCTLPSPQRIHPGNAATRGGATSVGAHDRGRIEAGLLADLVAWDADHEGAFGWAYGPAVNRLWLRGQELQL